MSVHVLLPLAVNSKSERQVNSQPPLGFEPGIFKMLTHFSDHSAKSHPQYLEGQSTCIIDTHRFYCNSPTPVIADKGFIPRNVYSVSSLLGYLSPTKLCLLFYNVPYFLPGGYLSAFWQRKGSVALQSPGTRPASDIIVHRPWGCSPCSCMKPSRLVGDDTHMRSPEI
jgi:hypothetical protein